MIKSKDKLTEKFSNIFSELNFTNAVKENTLMLSPHHVCVISSHLLVGIICAELLLGTTIPSHACELPTR
jgi:hypothetical protein